MSFRVATRVATRLARGGWSSRRTFAIQVPALGTEEEMKAQAIAQIRSRVQYQKELMATHDVHDDMEETWKWWGIFFKIAMPIVCLHGMYSFIFDEHVHRKDGPMPESMAVRSKEFPWECGDCDLFDLKCWDKCRAEKA